MDQTIRVPLLVPLACLTLLFSVTTSAAPKNIDLGGLVLSVSDSQTAQIVVYNRMSFFC